MPLNEATLVATCWSCVTTTVLAHSCLPSAAPTPNTRAHTLNRWPHCP